MAFPSLPCSWQGRVTKFWLTGALVPWSGGRLLVGPEGRGHDPALDARA